MVPDVPAREDPVMSRPDHHVAPAGVSQSDGHPSATDREFAVGRRTFMAGVGAASTGMFTTPAAGSAGNTRTRRETEPPFEAFFDDILPEQLSKHNLAGATVSVVADGAVQLTKGYGYADVDAREPVRAAETMFPVASTSKAVTGTAVMRAVEAGHVALDSDVNEYLDDVTVPATDADPVTLEHLGTHTAGFESTYVGQYARDRENPRPLGDVLADRVPPRVHPPGEVAHYSNYGIALAGHAASTAAGTTFTEYVREAVFDPLGMDRSTFRATPPEGFDDALTTAYDYDEEAEAFEEIDVPYELRRPAGAMATTAVDMANFMLMHLRGGVFDGQRFLSSETVSRMHERRFANHSAVDGLGYMFLERSRGDTRIVRHGGRLRGATSVMALFPDHDIGLFVAYNSTGSPDASEELFDAFVEEYAPPGDPPTVEPDGRPTKADALTGWYRLTRVPASPVKPLFGVAGTLEVRVEDDGTLVTAPSAPGVEPIRWIEIEPLVFQAVGDSPQVSPHDRLAFREADGEITYAFFGSPTGSYRRLAGYEHPPAHLGLFALFLFAFLSAVVGWTGQTLWWRFTANPPPESRQRTARWVAGLTAGLLLSPLVGLLAWLAGGSAGVGYGMPDWLPVVLALPVVGLLGTAVTVGFAGLAWRDGYWGLGSRLHYTLLAGCCVGGVGLLAYWNLLWAPF